MTTAQNKKKYPHSVRTCLNITASVNWLPLSSTQAWTLTHHLCWWMMYDSTVHSALQRASIKRCLRSATFWTCIWYTWCHIWYIAYFIFDVPYLTVNWIKIRVIVRPKSRGMNFEVSRCSSSVVWCTRHAGALTCWKL